MSMTLTDIMAAIPQTPYYVDTNGTVHSTHAPQTAAHCDALLADNDEQIRALLDVRGIIEARRRELRGSWWQRWLRMKG